MLLKENIIEGRYNPISHYNSIKMDNNITDFIFQFCNVNTFFNQVANLSRETAHASLFIFDYFSNSSDIQKYDIQLIAMVCILLSSKMFDVKPLSLSTLHRISAYVYNNSMILDSENIVLRVLNYDLFVRDHLIIDKVGLYLESIRFLIDDNDFERFKDICFKISDLIFEEYELVKGNNLNLLCAGLIQAALVIAVRRDGKLPITIRCK
jgi:hypothetical protein